MISLFGTISGKSLKLLPPDVMFQRYNAPNSISAGAPRPFKDPPLWVTVAADVTLSHCTHYVPSERSLNGFVIYTGWAKKAGPQTHDHTCQILTD